MASTSPATTKKKAKPSTDADSDIRDMVFDHDDASFVAHVFDEDEPFKFSTDVNAFILSGAMSGGTESIGSMRRLLMSLVLVPDTSDGDDPELARLAERDRFVSMMERQQNLSMERLAKFLGDLLEAAGKETSD